jgi:3-hydroxyisobutyrate dehydrogenase-like beta-hydroxyacid dehydrogenase
MQQKSAESLRAGVIGLGAMGYQMARHLRAKGFGVAGFDLMPDLVAAAREIGVTACASAEDVGRLSDIVIVMVATDQQVEDVLVHDGLAAALPRGGVVCIASSVSPDTCRRLTEICAPHGVDVLDTPVVLGQEAANEGTLTVLVGGPEAALEKARPVLSAFGRHILHLGESGTGQIAKTVNNMLLWACMSANYEVLTLAKKLGADLPKLIGAMAYSSGANWSLAKWGRSTGKWAEKDMDVALDLAQEAKVPVPLSALVDQLMKGMDQAKMKALLD